MLLLYFIIFSKLLIKSPSKWVQAFAITIKGHRVGMRSNLFQTIQTIKLFEWFESLKV
jgi:hypothetical protein